ncbi:peroxisomal sarcosine oxidase-like isoform X2 [Apostichopus japonicus]
MTYDCIVIGGGIVGTSSVYHLTMRGKKTLLLDQFPLPHTRGSSHGASRILRSSYDKPLYSHMTVEAMLLWKKLEQETKTKLFRKTGILVIDKAPYEEFEKSCKSVVECGGQYQEISPEELERRYPGVMSLPVGHRIYMENDAGTLKADKALISLREQIKCFGGLIQDEEKVQHIFPGEIVTVRTNKRTYKTKHLIVTAGAWTSDLLKPLGMNLPLSVERISVCYWKERVPGSSKKLPVFIDYSQDMYGLPCSEYSGLMKVCEHSGVKITHPDKRDATFNQTKDLNFICDYVRENLPGLESKPAIVESCMYTLTPDSDFVIDTLPRYPNIAFGAGFSGHGFKMAPVVGRILGELVFGDKLSYDITSLSAKRFAKYSDSSKL